MDYPNFLKLFGADHLLGEFYEPLLVLGEVINVGLVDLSKISATSGIVCFMLLVS